MVQQGEGHRTSACDKDKIAFKSKSKFLVLRRKDNEVVKRLNQKVAYKIHESAPTRFVSYNNYNMYSMIKDFIK